MIKVITEPNDGKSLSTSNKQMTKQCMYISLSYALETDINSLREIGNLNYRTYHSMFDEDKTFHKEALKKITDHFDVQVIVYSCKIKEKSAEEENSIEEEIYIDPNFIIDDKIVPRYIEGTGDKKILIAHYDEHFEFIHKIDKI